MSIQHQIFPHTDLSFTDLADFPHTNLSFTDLVDVFHTQTLNGFSYFRFVLFFKSDFLTNIFFALIADVVEFLPNTNLFYLKISFWCPLFLFNLRLMAFGEQAFNFTKKGNFQLCWNWIKYLSIFRKTPTGNFWQMAVCI